ncbi:hypothetical protein GSI_11715 [Ganoderma sinense ZZ0214-1]|uniref:Uncharacterized protein n=1 Tax=Ganoderma sinense ZZ0214-1 TaxID=1077348 RepID=A0A2G8RWR7_9APHY|nr:hypothetical protein GSI_11715 [Ganoderma sinense ZZ0214-1]
MSQADDDARFPGQRPTGLPPSPSRENPGQVFPRSDPKAAPVHSVPGTTGEHENHGLEALGNPYVLRESFTKLDHALTAVITAIQGEERSVGAAPNVEALVRKFSSWRDELTQIRTGHGQRGAGAAKREAVGRLDQQEGGLFAD